MSHSFPPEVRRAISDLLDQSGRKDLAAAQARISSTYRAGGVSSGAVTDMAAALAYAAARMPATFAAVCDAFERLAEVAPDFAPATLLDAGCGPGTATFAALASWASLTGIRQVDHSAVFLDLAARLWAGAGGEPARLDQARADLSAAGGSGAARDLVVASYALTECPAETWPGIVDGLWAATSGALVLVEPGTPAAHARLMGARDRLVGQGGVIAAPCPHAGPCPVLAPDWCHFSVRLARSRDHRQAKSAAMSYEDEKFAYLAVVRPTVSLRPIAARILDRPTDLKPGTRFKLCTADGRLDDRLVPRRDKTAFAAVRRLGWGDGFPD